MENSYIKDLIMKLKDNLDCYEVPEYLIKENINGKQIEYIAYNLIAEFEDDEVHFYFETENIKPKNYVLKGLVLGSIEYIKIKKNKYNIGFKNKIGYIEINLIK